jgi:nucleotide-binding universal stress UspA family protein
MTQHTTNPILVGIDGSTSSSIAAAWAADLGFRTGAPVIAIAAWNEAPTSFMDGGGDPAFHRNTDMEELATTTLHDAGVDGVQVTAIRGPITDTLLEAVDDFDASMLVVGTRGLGALSGLLLGSISRRLMFSTRRPLVVVPRTWSLDPPELTRVLVGVDRSAVAERVLLWAASFCSDVGVPATIVRCASPGCERPPGHVDQIDDRATSNVERALTPFRVLGVEYSIVIAHCDPRVALVENAENGRADLIVIGTRGQGQFSGLGGTASYLARHSPVPLAVIP